MEDISEICLTAEGISPQLSGQTIRTPTFRRFARIDSRESIRKKKPIFEALLSDSHSNSGDSRPVLAAIHFLEGRFAKKTFFSKRESIRRESAH